MKISIKNYWKMKKDIEIYNIEIQKSLDNLTKLSIEELNSKMIYDIAELLVRREVAEKSII